MDTKVKISDDGMWTGKKIFIANLVPGGVEMIYSTERKIEPEGAIWNSSLQLTQEEFQALVDAIHKDFKPSEGKYTEGKLEGTERHLQDLRQILKLK
ncbi:MAG: hypothetical protein AAB875_07335 [Patescibacteria group bacterium]